MDDQTVKSGTKPKKGKICPSVFTSSLLGVNQPLHLRGKGGTVNWTPRFARSLGLKHRKEMHFQDWSETKLLIWWSTYLSTAVHGHFCFGDDTGLQSDLLPPVCPRVWLATGETVYQQGQHKLRNWPSLGTQFLFPCSHKLHLLSLRYGWEMQREDSQGDGQLSRCGICYCWWLPGRCVTGFITWKKKPLIQDDPHTEAFHGNSSTFPPCLAVSSLDAREPPEHSQNSVSSLCLLEDLFSNSIK